MLSISIEPAETSLQLAIDQGIDSTNPMVQSETSFMELYNSRLQKSVGPIIVLLLPGRRELTASDFWILRLPVTSAPHQSS
ncbi:hypothetical protein TNCV_971231 [Trichonephila clavipes]|nr:hypothetical protein TNCV_971231 [Trichonephila clavipes]